MTADEMKALAYKKRQEVESVDDWLRSIEKRIRAAAECGKTILERPLGVRMPCSADQKRRIKEYFVANGFTWNADDSISWDSPGEAT